MITPRRLAIAILSAALLALAAPAIHAADCKAFDLRFDDWNGKQDGHYYVAVSKSNFVGGYYKIYIDDKCDAHPGEDEDYLEEDYVGPGAFAKNGRRAMEICELNMSESIAEVYRAIDEDHNYFYCVTGERKGPRRQRREHLFGIYFEGDAEGALALCKEYSRGRPKHSQANYVEPYPAPYKYSWDCYRVWKVSKKYLERVGA